MANQLIFSPYRFDSNVLSKTVYEATALDLQSAGTASSPDYYWPFECLIERMRSSGKIGAVEITDEQSRPILGPKIRWFNKSTSYTNQCLIHGTKINDVRYVNKLFESVNQRLQKGAFFMGCVETSEQRWERIKAKTPPLFYRLRFVTDFLVKRVWPKLPYLKKLYFQITKGRNRVISEMETYGRLVSCGFKLIESQVYAGRLYFVAKKVGAPDYNIHPTYGALIKLNRIGKHGKPIKVYKFRTMSPYSEYLQSYIHANCGLMEGGKMKNDLRITEFGRVMRKYWLDELPMLLNLVKGDLKLFGVRPISQHYLSLYPTDFQRYRSQFKPGLLPPFYADMPTTLNEIVESEKKYLQAYERKPLTTDFNYFYRVMHNIIFNKARSN